MSSFILSGHDEPTEIQVVKHDCDKSITISIQDDRFEGPEGYHDIHLTEEGMELFIKKYLALSKTPIQTTLF